MSKKIETVEEMISHRTPMQVREKILHPGDMSIFPLCPRCDISFEYEYQKFCRYCGQKLKWTYYSKAKLRLPQGFYFKKEYDEEDGTNVIRIYDSHY